MIKRHTDFQDLMNVSIETGDAWLDKKLNSHICYGGKGGGGGGGSQQQDVPPTLRPYVTDVLNRAKSLYGSGQQYQPYMGERVVPFTQQELAAQQGITGMVGRGISQDPFLTAAGSYYAPAYGLAGQAAEAQLGGGQLLGGIAPALGQAERQLGAAEQGLGAYGQRVGQAEEALAATAPTLGQYEQQLRLAGRDIGVSGQRLGQAEQALAATAPALSQYEQQLRASREALAATQPTISQAEQQLGMAGQLYGEAAEAQRRAAGGVDIGQLEIGKYMSPYQQQVTDIAKREAIKESQLYGQQLASQAAQTGGFGGSRQALLEAQAASDLGGRLADIQARGQQEAYQQALQTAGQQQQLGYGERVAQLQRQGQLGAGLAGLAGGAQQLGIGGYGAVGQMGRETAAQMAQLGGMYGQLGQAGRETAAQMAQMAGQYGSLGQQRAGLGSQYGALGQAGQQYAGQIAQLGGLYGDISQQRAGLAGGYGGLAGQYAGGAGAYGQQAAGLGGVSQLYGGLGQQVLGQGYRELGYLSGVGEAQRDLGQRRADIAYGDFIEQREFPSQQLQKYSSLIQGFPYQISMPGAQPSQFQQVVGGAATLGGLGRGLGFFEEGGNIGKDGKKYPNTGLAALAKERPDVVKNMGYKKGGTVYRQVGGPTVGGLSGIMSAEQRRIKKALENEYASLLRQYKDFDPEKVKGLPGAAESMQNYNRMKQLENELILMEKGNISPIEKIEEARGTPKAVTPVQQTVTPVVIPQETPTVTSAEQVEKPATPTTESVEDLEKVLEEAYKFDREAKEKAIKSQQGFDIAALGMQLMSKPMSEISPQLISQLGVSQKELAGLSEEEAKNKLQKELTRIAIKKSKADTKKTLAEAAEAQATAGYLLGGSKEAKGAYEPKDIQNMLSPTSLVNSEKLIEYTAKVNEYVATLNRDFPNMSKEDKELEVAKYIQILEKGSSGLPGQPIERTSTRVALEENE
jgi:hypothetical protein